MSPRTTRQARRRPRAGFTLLELLLGLSLTAIVGYKAYTALSTVRETVGDEDAIAALDDQARRVLKQIAYEVMGANRHTLNPDSPAPGGTERLRYQVNLGVQDGEVVWGDPEQLQLAEQDRAVIWSENPGTERERRAVWTSLVSPYLAGEIPDGMDNNGNGLIDERGLSFVMNRNSVTVRLTLERIDEKGEAVSRTVETTVTCRNLTSED